MDKRAGVSVLDMLQRFPFYRDGDFTTNYCRSIGWREDKNAQKVTKIIDLKERTIYGINSNPVKIEAPEIDICGKLNCNSIDIDGKFLLSGYVDENTNDSYLMILDSNDYTKNAKIKIAENGSENNTFLKTDDVEHLRQIAEQDIESTVSNPIKVLANFLMFVPELSSNQETYARLQQIASTGK